MCPTERKQSVQDAATKLSVVLAVTGRLRHTEKKKKQFVLKKRDNRFGWELSSFICCEHLIGRSQRGRIKCETLTESSWSLWTHTDWDSKDMLTHRPGVKALERQSTAGTQHPVSGPEGRLQGLRATGWLLVIRCSRLKPDMASEGRHSNHH